MQCWLPCLLAISQIGVGENAPADDKRLIDLRCGAYCLYIALAGLERWNGAFAELEKELGQPTLLGYSMGQLQSFADNHSTHTLAVETNIAQLRGRPRPFACIALLNDNHFVLVYEIDERQVYIIDPPRQYELPLDSFRANWTGKVLLLSTVPMTAQTDRTTLYWTTIGVALVAVGGFAVWRRLRG